MTNHLEVVRVIDRRFVPCTRTHTSSGGFKPFGPSSHFAVGARSNCSMRQKFCALIRIPRF